MNKCFYFALIFLCFTLEYCTNNSIKSGTIDETDTQIALKGRVVNSTGSGVWGVIARLKSIGLSDTTNIYGEYLITATKNILDSLDININDLSDTLEILKNDTLLDQVLVNEFIDTISDVIYTIDPRLIGYWDFNEGYGDTLHDLTQNKNHGVIHRAQWVEGHDGIALKFTDEDSSFVIIPATLELEPETPFTIEAIVVGYEAQSNPNAAIIRKSENVGDGYALYWGNENDTITFDIDYHVLSLFDNTNIINRSYKWNHIVVEIQDSLSSLYLNGELVDQVSIAATLIHSNDLYFGGGMFGLHRCYFNGKIDDVKFYADTLGAAEIKQRYQSLNL